MKLWKREAYRVEIPYCPICNEDCEYGYEIAAYRTDERGMVIFRRAMCADCARALAEAVKNEGTG